MNQPKPFEIGTAADFQQKYPGYFEEVVKNLPAIDPNVVPENLKQLIVYAQHWGIPDCFVRQQYCDAATPEMISDFKKALAGTHSLYEDWCYAEDGDEEEDEDKSEKTKYAHWRFTSMYVAEMESFNGQGLRGFTEWQKANDPEGYARWHQG